MRKKIQQYFSTKWPAIIWSAIIFLLLVIPPINISNRKPLAFSGIDKAIHIFLFGIMVLLWGYNQLHFIFASNLIFRRIVAIVILTTLYGIAMEYVQGWVGRDFDVWDMVADAAGAFTAGGWLFLKKRRPW